MIPWWALAISVLGINVALWGLAGLCRLLTEVRGRRGATPARTGAAPSVRELAVLIAAHNEATVIAENLAAIKRLVPRKNIHVVSDASTDRTEMLAKRAGVRVIRTPTNLGKAGALQHAVRMFRLPERFRAVMLLDADTHVQPGYFDAALPLLADPGVVAVAGCVHTATSRALSPIGRVLVAHRTRIYALGQHLQKFGQTWRKTNATHIVPGFASIYRTEILEHIDINPPGLVIEDFNMTFEVYQKRLGKVGFSLRAVAVTQDPDNLRDYLRQTRRWALGLWQTVRRHRPRRNLFSIMLALLLLEMLASGLLYLLVPPLLLVLLLPDLIGPAASAWPVFGPVHGFVSTHMTMESLLIGVLATDYATTCLVAAFVRRPTLLLVGVFFPLLRLADAALALGTLPQAWLTHSDGRWRSPTRRAVTADRGRSLPAGKASHPSGRSQHARKRAE